MPDQSPLMADEDSSSNQELLEPSLTYFEIRMMAFTSYSDRVWNRFNWLLTLELAILGFYFSNLDKITQNILLARGIPSVGLIVAVLWFLMGVEDTISLRKHRLIIQYVENSIRKTLARHSWKTDHSRSSFRFRQNWLLFVFPILTIGGWILLYKFH